MSEYDLRSAFPLNGKELTVDGEAWKCHLAEVSDSRPEADRLSWYLVFERNSSHARSGPTIRKLEIVTSADHLLKRGWAPDSESRVIAWLQSEDDDGRLEWLEQ
jgi:hypothetical protein